MHPAVAEYQLNLASIEVLEDNYQGVLSFLPQAWQLYETALNTYISIYGPEHAEVARTQNDFGVLHFKLQKSVHPSNRRYEEAHRLCLASLDLATRLFGRRHPDVANALVNLGDIAVERHDPAVPVTLIIGCGSLLLRGCGALQKPVRESPVHRQMHRGSEKPAR